MNPGPHASEEPQEVTCRRLVGLVTDYLEGALDPEVRARFEEHLAECPHCVEYVAEIRRTSEALGQVPVQALSPATREGLLTAFRDFRAG
ncbi:anti-sigma factor family protein [Spongisporangium articulatum]|uniref:Anti-sigma factor family protein n=1 Tax=Spongisporangium articulatum TaxID=3362603 RepID=A0ABW8AMI7_9ACTN